MSEPIAIYETPKSIAEEAIEIVNGTRRNNYGNPEDNHQRTAQLWEVYLNATFMKNGWLTAEDVCYLNILQKIARTMEHDKRDNAVDIVGYAMNVELIKKAKGASW